MWLINWTGSAWTRVLHEKFLYDGWNLLGAFNGTNAAIIRSFLWGLDLSGSMQGAGGVGGLIAFRQHSGSLAGSHFAAYDGNGNVMALVDGKIGSTSARYEYDPFGQTIRASGTMAVANPVRFSSKVVDDETDYAYYGYRYLNPNTGRWLNRDPFDEPGFRKSSNRRRRSIHNEPNPVAFVRNSSTAQFDALGLLCADLCSPENSTRLKTTKVLVLPTSLTPDSYEEYSTIINDLHHMHASAALIEPASGLVELAITESTSNIHGAWESFVNSIGNGGPVRIWTKIWYERCIKTSCCLFWTRLKWVDWDPSGWRAYTKGAFTDLGYAGFAEASEHIDDALRSHIEELIEDPGQVTHRY